MSSMCITCNGTNQYYMPLDMVPLRGKTSLLCYFCKKSLIYIESRWHLMEIQSEGHCTKWLIYTLWKYWGHEGHLREYSRLKENDETWKLFIGCDSGLNSD